jgi:hypothetical protein
MSAARVGAVEVVGVERDAGGELVTANVTVQGHWKLHIVDYNVNWGKPARWYCTCGHAPTCSHISAARRAIDRQRRDAQ